MVYDKSRSVSVVYRIVRFHTEQCMGQCNLFEQYGIIVRIMREKVNGSVQYI